MDEEKKNKEEALELNFLYFQLSPSLSYNSPHFPWHGDDFLS